MVWHELLAGWETPLLLIAVFEVRLRSLACLFWRPSVSKSWLPGPAVVWASLLCTKISEYSWPSSEACKVSCAI